MTKESAKENKPASFKALFLKPIRQWLALNRRSPNNLQLSAPVIQHPNNNGLSVTMDDLSVANQHRRTNNGSDEHFKRSARARMSLPIMQQNEFRRQAYSQLQIRGQQQPRSMGHIYLQYKGETKQANLPNELTAVDTIRALFVCAFPNMLSMEYMSHPHVKIYIYNPSCNIFYELRNIEDVRHESVLRIHQSDPTLALPPQQQLYTMRLLPPIPQQQHPLSLPQPTQQQQHFQQQQQQQQQQPPLQRTPIQQASLHQQHIQPAHQMAPHQISPHLQIPPPKPRRMIPVMNGMNGMNGLNSMNNSMSGINGGMNGLYHNGSVNGLQSANNNMSSNNNLIYMAAPQSRRTTPSPWLPPSQI